jgi:hypothetical protein
VYYEVRHHESGPPVTQAVRLVVTTFPGFRRSASFGPVIGRARDRASHWVSGQGEDQCKGFVHPSHLACTQVSLDVVQPTYVQGAQLLHHHPRWLTCDFNLGSKTCRPHTLGSGRNEHRRKPNELVRLDHHGISRPVLLMATAARKPHAVDVAPGHSGHSAAIASMSAITRFRSARSTGSSASRETSAASPDRLRSRSAVSVIAWRAASARVTPRLRAMSSKARQPSDPRRSESGWEAAATEAV